MDAMDFLAKPPASLQPVYAVTGEDRFLKGLVFRQLQSLVLQNPEDDLAFTPFEGEKIKLADVLDELQTLPFLGGRRLVVIYSADPFVTEYRDVLERYLAKPSPIGVLALDVKKWASTTRLAKALVGNATLSCEAIKPARLPSWCTEWAKTTYQKQLTAEAARLLVDLVGAEMGVLDQEIAKLACFVGDRTRITPEEVDKLVGHSRMNNVWQMLDAVAAGQLDVALRTLNFLFEQGNDAYALLGATIWQLRQVAQVARLQRQGQSADASMSQVGIHAFSRERVQRQLRHLGPRATQLFGWLLEIDEGFKSSGALAPRTLLERLVVKLARASA
jgi:DNA polymerase-3 subunit delta